MAHKSTKGENLQHARFVEAARSLGCDESEEAFDEKLEGIVKQMSTGERKTLPLPSTSKE